MSKNEAAASKLRAERDAREHGWRASHDEVELPPEKRVYKYGREEIRVGGRASQVVDETVAQLQKERQNVRGSPRPQLPRHAWLQRRSRWHMHRWRHGGARNGRTLCVTSGARAGRLSAPGSWRRRG